jgi:hypothetical protein
MWWYCSQVTCLYGNNNLLMVLHRENIILVLVRHHAQYVVCKMYQCISILTMDVDLEYLKKCNSDLFLTTIVEPDTELRDACVNRKSQCHLLSSKV